MRRERVIIVGAGPAGTAAAVQCRRLGVPPLLLDRTGLAGGLAENARCIENYPGLPESISGPGFAESLRAHLGRFGLSIDRVEVTGIERNGEGFSVKHGGGELFAKSIILASGTEPLRLALPGEGEIDGERLFYEIRPLLRHHMKPRDVVVVGGGEAACDYALTLAAAGATVHLVMRSDRLRARGMLARTVERTSAVHMYRESRCERIVSSPRLSVHVRNSAAGSETELNPDALLVAVGRRSTAPRLLGAMGVSVSDCAAGLVPGLFVVGDARVGSIGQIGMAVGDGLSAAAAAIAFLERG